MGVHNLHSPSTALDTPLHLLFHEIIQSSNPVAAVRCTVGILISGCIMQLEMGSFRSEVTAGLTGQSWCEYFHNCCSPGIFMLNSLAFPENGEKNK